MKISAYTVLISAFLFSACGGGGGGGGAPPPPGSPPPPPPPQATLSGQFKDSNVEGLAYTTPSLSGTTDALGTFTYRAGESVEFSIGGVSIGSAPGDATLTPVDLVAGGSSNDTEVVNIARFLLLLDENEDPSDGIRISTAVRQAAANWTQVDFSVTDLGNELVTIISDVASVDGRVASLPGAPQAQAHLSATAHCILAGVFAGTRTFSGGVSGDLVMVMNPVTGVMRASFGGNTGADFSSSEGVSVDELRSFNLTRSGDNDNIEGRFDSMDELSGVLSIGGQSGQFTVSRFAGDAASKFKFVGNMATGSSALDTLTFPMILRVDAAGTIVGNHYVVMSGTGLSLGGSLVGQDFEMLGSADNAMYTGSHDASLLAMGNVITGNASYVWRAQGCRLN